VEQALVFHSDLFHEVSLDYHTSIIFQQGIKYGKDIVKYLIEKGVV
jgi:hypothetical protein